MRLSVASTLTFGKGMLEHQLYSTLRNTCVYNWIFISCIEYSRILKHSYKPQIGLFFNNYECLATIVLWNQLFFIKNYIYKTRFRILNGNILSFCVYAFFQIFLRGLPYHPFPGYDKTAILWGDNRGVRRSSDKITYLLKTKKSIQFFHQFFLLRLQTAWSCLQM